MNAADIVTVGNGSILMGRIARLPSTSGRTHQRVKVDWVTDLDNGRILVMGNLLYRADNAIYRGDFRGRFVTIVKTDATVTVENEEGR